MKLRLPAFLSSPIPRSADVEYQCGLSLLKKQHDHRAMKHFRNALRVKPDIAADIAEHCVEAKRPKLALQVIDEYKKVPNPWLDLDLATRISSVCAAAHHTLSHSRAGSFLPKHNASEVNLLENVSYSSAQSRYDGYSRFSKALAERYCHLKYGACFDVVRHDEKRAVSGDEDVSLFIKAMDIALFRLEHGDAASLDILEGLYDHGPSTSNKRVSGILGMLRESLSSFVEKSTGADKARAQRVLLKVDARPAQ